MCRDFVHKPNASSFVGPHIKEFLRMNPSPSNNLLIFSRNPSKRSGERFHLIWSVLWIGFFGFVVISKWYEQLLDRGYMLCGLALSGIQWLGLQQASFGLNFALLMIFFYQLF
jgi:hypothetical protein